MIQQLTTEPFENVIDFQEGPGIMAKDFHQEGVPLIRLAGLTGCNSILTGCNYLDPAKVSKKWEHFRLRKGDVLLSSSASLGRISVIDDNSSGSIAYTGIIRMRPRDGRLFAPFIRYLLESKDLQEQLEIMGVGSVIRHFGPMHLRQMTVTFPPLPEQRRIAHILGALDDKIENNRKTAKTLEAMAQAIFKSWFVDFDPVRAKMAGESRESICKRLKLTPEILDLFPDRLVNSELGEIPEGWVAKSFGNICSRQSERVGSRDATVLSAVTKGHLAISDDYFTKRVYSKEIKNYLAVEQYDFAYNPSRINIGSIGMLESHFLGAVSPVYIVLRPAEGYQHFMNFYLALATTKKWISTYSSGSVRQSLSYDDFAAIPCIIPAKKAVDTFNIIHNDLKRLSDLSRDYSMRLTYLRDILLPKLISGEIRAPELEPPLEHKKDNSCN